MNECIFCLIAKRELPASIIFENEHVVAFLDIHPVNKGHILVIPKVHAVDINTVDAGTWTQVTSVVHKLAPIVKHVTNADGINIHMNNGSAAGQVVFHMHVHIIPRFASDGLMLWKGQPYETGELEQMANTLRAATA